MTPRPDPGKRLERNIVVRSGEFFLAYGLGEVSRVLRGDELKRVPVLDLHAFDSSDEREILGDAVLYLRDDPGGKTGIAEGFPVDVHREVDGGLGPPDSVNLAERCSYHHKSVANKVLDFPVKRGGFVPNTQRSTSYFDAVSPRWGRGHPLTLGRSDPGVNGPYHLQR